MLASTARYTRSSMLDGLDQDYVRTAQSKGLKSQAVVGHALRNSLLPVVTDVGTLIPLLLGGAVIVETIFTLPGIGRVTVTAATVRDFPVVMTTSLFAAIMVLLSNLCTTWCTRSSTHAFGSLRGGPATDSLASRRGGTRSAADEVS